jgi:hypothetical protein
MAYVSKSFVSFTIASSAASRVARSGVRGTTVRRSLALVTIVARWPPASSLGSIARAEPIATWRPIIVRWPMSKKRT